MTEFLTEMSPQFCWFLVQRSLEQSRDISVSMLLQVPCCGSAPETSVMTTAPSGTVLRQCAGDLCDDDCRTRSRLSCTVSIVVTAVRCDCDRVGVVLTRRTADRDGRSSTFSVVDVVSSLVFHTLPPTSPVLCMLFDVIATLFVARGSLVYI